MLHHRLLDTGRPVLVLLGAANALGARVVADTGHDAVYVTGAGIANTYLGAPDLGLLTLTELVDHAAAIRDAVELPLIVDADTGFGNAVGVQRTVRALERAGANAIQLEDQETPKRCGHFGGQRLISSGEMVQKIQAAADARFDEDLLVVARTDAYGQEGLEAALDRAHRYREAGADLLFVEGPAAVDDLAAIPRALDGAPTLINQVAGGKSPLLPLSDLDRFGYRIALFANVLLQASIKGMFDALTCFDQRQDLGAIREHLAPWEVR